MSEPLRLGQVCEGIFHWSATHPNTGHPAHSYYLSQQRLAIDPIGAAGLEQELSEHGGVERIALTNRHHLRDSARLVEAFGCEVVAPASGMHEFDGSEVEVFPYEWGGELAERVTAHQVGAICHDDGALLIRQGEGALALADGVIRWDGRLAFVPDSLMDNPPLVKQDQIEALQRLVVHDFQTLLLAHGDPIPTDAKTAIYEFIAEPRSAQF